MRGSVANAKFLAHSEAANIARRAINRRSEKEQFGTPLFGGPYLQHNPHSIYRGFVPKQKQTNPELAATHKWLATYQLGPRNCDSGRDTGFRKLD